MVNKFLYEIIFHQISKCWSPIDLYLIFFNKHKFSVNQAVMSKITKWLPLPLVLVLLFVNPLSNEKENYALKFDGKKGCHIGSGYLDHLKVGTIELTFYYRSRSMRTLFSASSEKSSSKNLSINVVKGKIQYYDRFNSSSFTSTSSLHEGQFYTLSIVFAENGPKMYINGVHENLEFNFQGKSKTVGWFSDVLKQNQKNSYHLGVFKRPNEEKRHFTGGIREFRIYNKALSFDKGNTVALTREKHSSDLIVHYDFDFNGQSFLDRLKSIVSWSYVNQASSKGNGIPYSEDTQNRVLFHFYVLISICLLLLVFYFLDRKGPIFLTPKNYIKGFDGMRGISILLVLITHLGWTALIDINSSVDIRLKYLLSGTTGVNIFFTLSGFLITSILLKERQKRGSINFKVFYLKRFLRLLPPLVLFLSALLIFMYFGCIASNYKSIGYSFFYISNYIPKAIYSSELGSTWSLSVEEQFYIFWPFAVYLFRRNRNLLIFLFLTIAVCLLFLLARESSFFLQLLDFMNYKELSTKYFTNRWIFPAILTILMGCFAGILSLNKNFMGRLKAKSGLLFLVGILLFSCFIFIPSSLFGLGWFVQSIGTSILILYVLLNQESKFVALMEYKPIAFIGKLSYGIYIYQGLFLGTGPFTNGMTIQEYPLNIILTFLIAILSYVLIEKRFLLLKKKMV